ncbi:neo-calmodulin-like [Lineus longissimus]|uniref:neo-calmodulin-like n=1 Tax=Lineus longissimus TaxID=88925 RepID=UPI002B4E3399
MGNKLDTILHFMRKNKITDIRDLVHARNSMNNLLQNGGPGAILTRHINIDELQYSVSSLVEKMSEKEIKEYKEHFSFFDKNNDGTITATEIGTVLRSLNMNPSEQELAAMIQEVDKDGNGTIEFPEFLDMMARQKAKDSKLTEDDIVQAFKMFDKDNNGFISLTELRDIMTTLGEALTTKELEAMVREADMDGDGQIDYKEFSKILCGVMEKA